MRLSLQRAANVVVASGAKYEIRVRSGRDDKGRAATPQQLQIPALRSGRDDKGRAATRGKVSDLDGRN